MNKDNDDLAGLIHQVASPPAETLPRPTFTPGPWKACDDTPYFPHVHIGYVEGGGCNHVITINDANDENGGVSMPEHVANAHLIAASPDLYEACQSVAPICKAINALIADDEDLRARFMVQLITHGLQDDYGWLIDNALAKAEGR